MHCKEKTKASLYLEREYPLLPVQTPMYMLTVVCVFSCSLCAISTKSTLFLQNCCFIGKFLTSIILHISDTWIISIGYRHRVYNVFHSNCLQ